MKGLAFFHKEIKGTCAFYSRLSALSYAGTTQCRLIFPASNTIPDSQAWPMTLRIFGFNLGMELMFCL
ncbi:hypothetical protein C1N53_04230 [Pontibacter sp. SGAir0037]|nr:hypothetical protein C1N53_04230 [Pontibacter sp. SGAir0037]